MHLDPHVANDCIARQHAQKQTPERDRIPRLELAWDVTRDRPEEAWVSDTFVV